MEQESAFSPSNAYQQGILALQEKSQLQNFLQFYARYQLNLKNSVLLYLASLQNPTAGQARTMEEWQAEKSDMEKRAVCIFMLRKIFTVEPKLWSIRK